MIEPSPPRDAERLPEEAARRLLTRASELEAARGAELSVAELRLAAREAGIAPEAFEQALAELREKDVVPPLEPPKQPALGFLRRHWPVTLIVAALIAVYLMRLLVPPT